MLQLDNPVFDPLVSQYYADLEALADRALSGELDEREYREELERITIAIILIIFLLGGGDAQSPDGRKFLDERNKIAAGSARKLASDLFDGRYSGSVATAGEETAVAGKDKLLSRLALWTFMLGGVYHRAQVTSPDPVRVGGAGGGEEKRYRWVMDTSKNNCKDCKALNGTVLTKNEWSRAGIYPQSWDLACKGINCGCVFVETDEPSIGFENVRF